MLIPRTQLKNLQSWIDEPEALVILGPRQVGKTTLMKQLMTWLKEEKQVGDSEILSFNLDSEQDKEKLASQRYLVDRLTGIKGKAYVFIDEVQRLQEPGLFLKGLIDQMPRVKFIVSGSSSLEIRSKVAEVLTGRKHVIRLLPLSVNEVADRRNYLESLLITGGYPRIFMTKGRDKQQARLEEIVTSYLDKDIENFLGIELIESYRKLLVLLADQVGELVNVSRFSKKLNLHFQTVERYLSVLQNTFVVDLVYPYATKPSLEIVKSPVPYFVDLGVRNFLINRFEALDSRTDGGRLFENLVYLELIKSVPSSMAIKFWRTKGGREIDFLVTNGLEMVPVEVKFTEFEKPEVTTSMRAFIEAYEPEVMVVVNKNLVVERRWGSAVVKYRRIEQVKEEMEKLGGG